MLLGQVKLGMPQCATALKPELMKRETVGMHPAARAASKYSGSPPSTHTTATGASGTRYATPLSSTPSATPLIGSSHHVASGSR